MNVAQTWTVIGGFFALMTFTLGLVLQVVRSEFTGLRGEFNARFDAVDLRFDGVDRRIDTLDRDVQRLVDVHFQGPDKAS